jgi:dihydroorotate dehydrogenase electron transfer subunit
LLLSNAPLQGDYWLVSFLAPEIALRTAPGQFVHVQIPDLAHRVLRRPFSVFDTDPGSGTVRVVYKLVGEGTRQLARTPKGVHVSLLGPLGHGFSPLPAGGRGVIVAGGYGNAATYLQAKTAPDSFLCLFGGRSERDLILVDAFQTLGCEVRLSTDDGSCGYLLEETLEQADAPPEVYACGPNAMLAAVARIGAAHGVDAEVSLDHAMCCGVGACFACVHRMKADNDRGWTYTRTCLEGPVFKAGRAVWD